jgi:hypothetical protein
MRRLLVLLGVVVALVAPQAAPASALVPIPPGTPTTVPTACTIQAGRFQVLPAPTGTSHAVRVTTVAIDCDPTVGIITENVQLLRYWTNTGAWTVERARVSQNPNRAVALDMLFYCNTPGARMALRVEDRFFRSGQMIAVVTYPGRTTAICPR